MLILSFPTNGSLRTLAMETAPADNQSAVEIDPTDFTGSAEINPFSETPSDSANRGQINQGRSLSEPYINNQVLTDNSRQQSAPKSIETELSPNLTATDTPGIVLNSLPEVTTPEDLDTLGKIIRWWSENALPMKLWYLFLSVAIIFFIFRQTAFRKPLLFVSLVIFGFYLGNTVNPINSIFSLPVETGIKFFDSLVLVAIPIILSLLMGRFFCGWVCPIGAMQEFIHPENLKLQLPLTLDRIFGYLRYLMLLGGLLLSWSAMSNVWKSYDPFQTFFTFKWSVIAISLLGIILVGSICIERFFCRYLCPLGAVLTIPSRLSLLKMRPDSGACIACGKCSQPGVCSMRMVSAVNPYTDIPKIDSSECIICHRCAAICRYAAIKLSFPIRNRVQSSQIENPDQNVST